MGKISFRYLEKTEREMILPQLFRILHTNMSQIAPTGSSYEEDQSVWMSYLLPALECGDTNILLMYAGENLAGYFQYSVDGDTLRVDEVEIRPEYQWTMVFYRLCQYLLRHIPGEVKYLESYVHVDNSHSISIHEGLGMECIGKNKSGTSWHFRGERSRVEARFRYRKGENMKYNKLVRDKIPEIIEAQGERPNIRILEDGEYRVCLEQKLDEEVREYHADKNLEELADILEVVFALAEDLGYSKEELMEIYRKKNDARGGFRRRIFLISNEG